MKRRYQLIVADPPWEYSDKLRQSSTRRGAQDVYTARLSAIDLLALPVGDVADDTALLALWCTSSHLPLGLDVLDAWGFRYTQCAVWGKVQLGDATKPRIGMGRLFRQSTEFILIGVRGGAHSALEQRNRSNLFLSPQLAHSVKPEAVQDALKAMFPAFTTRLELFARRNRRGWRCVGNEISGRDIRDDLAEMGKR